MEPEARKTIITQFLSHERENFAQLAQRGVADAGQQYDQLIIDLIAASKSEIDKLLLVFIEAQKDNAKAELDAMDLHVLQRREALSLTINELVWKAEELTPKRKTKPQETVDEKETSGKPVRPSESDVL